MLRQRTRDGLVTSWALLLAALGCWWLVVEIPQTGWGRPLADASNSIFNITVLLWLRRYHRLRKLMLPACTCHSKGGVRAGAVQRASTGGSKCPRAWRHRHAVGWLPFTRTCGQLCHALPETLVAAVAAVCLGVNYVTHFNNDTGLALSDDLDWVNLLVGSWSAIVVKVGVLYVCRDIVELCNQLRALQHQLELPFDLARGANRSPPGKQAPASGGELAGCGHDSDERPSVARRQQTFHSADASQAQAAQQMQDGKAEAESAPEFDSQRNASSNKPEPPCRRQARVTVELLDSFFAAGTGAFWRLTALQEQLSVLITPLVVIAVTTCVAVFAAFAVEVPSAAQGEAPASQAIGTLLAQDIFFVLPVASALLLVFRLSQVSAAAKAIVMAHGRLPLYAEAAWGTSVHAVGMLDDSRRTTNSITLLHRVAATHTFLEKAPAGIYILGIPISVSLLFTTSSTVCAVVLAFMRYSPG